MGQEAYGVQNSGFKRNLGEICHPEVVNVVLHMAIVEGLAHGMPRFRYLGVPTVYGTVYLG